MDPTFINHDILSGLELVTKKAMMVTNYITYFPKFLFQYRK